MTHYLMHIRSQHCRHCGAEERLSSLYQAEALPENRYGRGTKLLPCNSLPHFAPIHYVELPRSFVPACAACVDDEQRQAGAALQAAWAETLRRKAEPATPSPVAPRGTALEDLA